LTIDMRAFYSAKEKIGRYIYFLFRKRIFLKSAYGPRLKYSVDKTYRLSLYGQYGDRVMMELKSIHDNDMFLDIGANTGLFSIVAAKAAKDVKVFSWEPNKTIFPLLMHNIIRNGCVNIVPFNAAISDVDGEVSFTSVEKHSGKSHISTGETAGKVLSLSKKSLEFLQSITFHECIIKIDVEGAEYKVLCQLEDFFKSHAARVKIIVEINDEHLQRFDNTRQEIVDYLSGFGFEPKYKEEKSHYDEVFECSRGKK